MDIRFDGRAALITRGSEDLVIIEGQAARRDPAIPTIDVTADAAGIAARRLLERLIAAEARKGFSVAG